MNEYITIRNFGPLRNIENLPIKQFTVLIGESAIGKSTLMKVVAMMRYLFKMSNIRWYLKHSKITSSTFRLRLNSMMERQGMAKMFSSESVINYRVVMDDNTEYCISIENGKMGSLPAIAPQHLLFSKVSFISENRNIIPTWAQKANQNKGATLGFYFHETNTDFVRASESDKVVRLDYLGMNLQITHPKGKPTRYMIVPDDNRHSPIELREASSGIQTSASVALIVKDFAAEYSFKDAFKRSVRTEVDCDTHLTGHRTLMVTCISNVYVLQPILLDGAIREQHRRETTANLLVVGIPAFVTTLPRVTRLYLMIGLAHQ